MRRIIFFLSRLLLSAAFLLFLPLPGNAAENRGYTGSESCKDCHEDYDKSYRISVHAKKAIPAAPANRQECESCHGPASQHVEEGGGRGIGVFAFTRKAEGRAKSGKCLSCHEESKVVAFWNMNRHSSADVSCDDCHSVHGKKENLLKTEEPDLCFGCHRDIRFQTNKQSRHPVNERMVTHQKLTCSSCHDTMGGFSTEPVGAFSTRTSFGTNKMIRADAVNELCFKCHTEKRGPFAWEHAPVAENCLHCHEPHGSNHSNLLVSKQPLLCRNCHDVPLHPSQPYTSFQRFLGTGGGKNRFIGRSCLNCHQNIHGSNFPGEAGHVFVR